MECAAPKGRSKYTTLHFYHALLESKYLTILYLRFGLFCFYLAFCFVLSLCFILELLDQSKFKFWNKKIKMFVTIQLFCSALENHNIIPRVRKKHLEKCERTFLAGIFPSFFPFLCEQQRAISSNNPIFKKEGAMPKEPEIKLQQIKSCKVVWHATSVSSPLFLGHQCNLWFVAKK